MPDDILIAWWKGDPESKAEADVADVTVLQDGRVRLSERFGGGEGQLSEEDLNALRRFVFDEQRFLEIDEDALRRDVQAAAAARRQQFEGTGAEAVTAPQMDAGTTVLRADQAGASHEIRYFDLVGDAQSYPDVMPLQRIRLIELRMLELAERLSARGAGAPRQ